MYVLRTYVVVTRTFIVRYQPLTYSRDIAKTKNEHDIAILVSRGFIEIISFCIRNVVYHLNAADACLNGVFCSENFLCKLNIFCDFHLYFMCDALLAWLIYSILTESMEYKICFVLSGSFGRINFKPKLLRHCGTT